MDDWELRRRIYATFAAAGTGPSDAELVEWAGSPEAANAALQRLHESHAIVLDETGRLRMALPFSAIATQHRVVSGTQSWWANCAWDALAIPAALGIDAEVDATWLDTGEPVALSISKGRLSSTAGHVHFEIPARHWWDDIVET